MGEPYKTEKRQSLTTRRRLIDAIRFDNLAPSFQAGSTEAERHQQGSPSESIDVVIVTQDEPFYMPWFYRSFFDELGGDVNIRWITILDTFDESFLDSAQRAYQLYGPKNFVRLGIRYLQRTAADRLGIAHHSVRSIAHKHDVSTETRLSVNAHEFVDRIDHEKIDVVLSVSAPEIFDAEVLHAPQWGCLNVHTAKLPQYRGLLPTFWALYHGDDEIGVTVHTMAEEIDRGQIVRQTTFQVGDRPTLHEVIQRGKRVGGELAAETLAEIAAGNESLDPMVGEESYFSFPTVEERREFQRNGGVLL